MGTKLISIWSNKGGISKTTTTILLATNLCYYHKKKVAIIDCDDDQWSTFDIKDRELLEIKENYSDQEITDLYENKKIIEYDVYKAYLNKDSAKNNNQDVNYIVDVIKELEEESYDYIFIDMGNRSLNYAKELYEMIDSFLIPFRLDKEEIIKARSFYHLVKDHFTNAKPFLLTVFLDKTSKKFNNFIGIKELFKQQNLDYFEQAVLKRDRYPEIYRSFFFPMKESLEKKEGQYNFFNFMIEFIKRT